MAKVFNQLPAELDRVQWGALVVGSVALFICILGWIFSPTGFFTAYLFAYLFVLGVTLGAMSLVMLHQLTGGAWGRPIRGICETAMSLIPLVAIFFIPILFGLGYLFPWAQAHLVAADQTLQHQRPYLNAEFFTLRAAIYLAGWIMISSFLAWASLRYQRTGESFLARWMRRISGFGLIFYAVSISLASIDWIMSRQLHWSSSILGFIVLCGQALTALAFAIVILRLIVTLPPIPEYVSTRILVDLGNLLLTLVILWSYLSFAQLLVIWSGNMQREASWYVKRGIGVANSWRYVGLALLTLHFFVPFVMLLFRHNKRYFNILTSIAALLLVTRTVELYWLAAPSSLESNNGLFITWLTPFPLLGMGGLWLAAFVWLLRRRPLECRMEIESQPVLRDQAAPAR